MPDRRWWRWYSRIWSNERQAPITWESLSYIQRGGGGGTAKTIESVSGWQSWENQTGATCGGGRKSGRHEYIIIDKPQHQWPHMYGHNDVSLRRRTQLLLLPLLLSSVMSLKLQTSRIPSCRIPVNEGLLGCVSATTNSHCCCDGVHKSHSSNGRGEDRKSEIEMAFLIDNNIFTANRSHILISSSEDGRWWQRRWCRMWQKWDLKGLIRRWNEIFRVNIEIFPKLIKIICIENSILISIFPKNHELSWKNTKNLLKYRQMVWIFASLHHP